MRLVTPRTTTLVLASAVAAAVLSGSFVATASAGTSPGSSPTATETSPGRGDGGRARLDLACARVPNAITRTENLQVRLAGDEQTRGSLLWLQSRADVARDAGRDDLATALDNRLVYRTELADLLPLRLQALQDAAVACENADL